jgi:hypothetical protein
MLLNQGHSPADLPSVLRSQPHDAALAVRLDSCARLALASHRAYIIASGTGPLGKRCKDNTITMCGNALFTRRLAWGLQRAKIHAAARHRPRVATLVPWQKLQRLSVSRQLFLQELSHEVLSPKQGGVRVGIIIAKTGINHTV